MLSAASAGGRSARRSTLSSPLPCEPNSGLKISGRRVAFHSARARRRDAGPMQQKRRHGLVDAALDRAGVVPYPDTALAQRVQQTQAEGDLLKRAGRDRAHEDRVGQRSLEARNIDAARKRGVEGAARQRRHHNRCAAPAHGFGEAAHMPVAALLFQEQGNARVPARWGLSGSSRRRCLEQVRQRGRMRRCRDWRR